MKNKSVRGVVFIVLGVLMMVSALILGTLNFREEQQAGKSASELTDAFLSSIPAPPDSASFVSGSEIHSSDKRSNVISIDGTDFMAVLYIPEFELTLPVAGDYSREIMKESPCRYSGRIEDNNLVIAAHNYHAHFRKLMLLSIGSEVFLILPDGSSIGYTVCEIETLMPYESERMTESSYDLTLYTCTVGKDTRYTVRCDRTEP